MTEGQEKLGVLVVNFGEPAEATLEVVRSYLERIFLQNVDLEDHEGEAAVQRARQLAARRAPELVEEYELIGGSPLNEQADAQVVALEAELALFGGSVTTYSAFQFTDPTIVEKVREAKHEGIDHLVVLPGYPICGQSTTVAVIDRVQEAMRDLDWSGRLSCVAGWHHHPDYVSLRVATVRTFVTANDLNLDDPDTLLYFSVHGTPVKYLNEGNRYDRYVDEHTRLIAEELGVGERYAVGFQNHTNRKIEWTQPDNQDRIDEIEQRRLVVVPISFMHEQSETLAELDHHLREYVEHMGMEFHRVPVPHDDPAFVRFLTNLVIELVDQADSGSEGGVLAPCRCSGVAGTVCTNGARDLPPSPYIAQTA